MIRATLVPFATTPCEAVRSLSATVTLLAGGKLRLHYTLDGRLADLRIPPETTPERRNELWKHTCFEAFVAPAEGSAYREFNFAPSRDWAAYDFTDYRVNRGALPATAPSIAVSRDGDRLEVEAEFDIDFLPQAAGRLGLTAVIETRDGELSYWALAHPAARPDFHHAAGFMLSFG